MFNSDAKDLVYGQRFHVICTSNVEFINGPHINVKEGC